ncbi:hypothetical protein [Ferrovibrio sp.]|uniref:hypothetical protein n=1 Tax=Ferrovibrio sp. TaxID=1917215 RepID=UPI00311E04BF
MRYPLRTLSQIQGCRRATEGRIGAEQVAVCGICGFKWSVDLAAAARVLGDDATGRDLVDRANCPACSGGQAAEAYVVVDTEPLRRPAWFGGLFEERLDTAASFPSMKRRRP